VLESTKSERRIVFTQPVATADSQTAEGKSSGHCVPVGHIWNSQAVVVEREQTVVHQLARLRAIETNPFSYGRSILQRARLYVSRRRCKSMVHNRLKKNACLTFLPNKFKPVYRLALEKQKDYLNRKIN